MAKKTFKNRSSSSSRNSKPTKVTKKPIRSTSRKQAPIKRKVSTRRPSQGKKPSKKITAQALLKDFYKLERQLPTTKKPTKRPVKKPAKRTSYKDKYQNDLAKVLERLEKGQAELQKEITDLKKGPAKPGPKKEAFPEEEDMLEDLPVDQQQAIALIAELRREINQRNIMLDEMMNQPGKLYFTD